MVFLQTVLACRSNKQSGGVTPPPIENQLDIYVIMGQSNAKGNGTKAELPIEYQQELAGTLIYDYNTHEVYELINPDANTQTSGKTHGAEVAFSINRRDNPTEHPFAIVKYPRSGTSLAQDWLVANNNINVAAKNCLVAAMNRARVEGYTPIIKHVFWHQGESDSAPEEYNAYAQNMQDLIEYFDAQVPEMDGAPWIMCRIFENSTGKAQVNQAKLNHVNSNPSRYYWQSPVEQYSRMSVSDTTHASTAGLWEMGEDWYNIASANNLL